MTTSTQVAAVFIQLKEQTQFHARFTQNMTEERNAVSVRVVFTLHYLGVKYKIVATTQLAGNVYIRSFKDHIGYCNKRTCKQGTTAMG